MRDQQGSPDLRRLKWIGIALPIVFLVGIETVRYAFVEGDAADRTSHLALAAVTALAVIGFAFLMFFFIERAQRQVIRQNRELAAVNAVSTAVQGELGVDQIIRAALESVVETSGATDASVTVFATDGHEGIERRLSVAPHASPEPPVGSTIPHLIDIPLSTGTSVVGRMRLHLAEGAAEPDLLASATLQNIGHQLASSIQIGQLVADLQRRKLEGHGLYDVLLRISNQGPLVDTLGAVVRHARDLLDTEDAVMCLNAATSQSVQLVGTGAGMTSLVDGTVCIAADHDRFADVGERLLACPVRSTEDERATAEVTMSSPDGALGDIWIARRPESPYTARERGYLRTLAELASIAIMSARMRENERSGAIIAERDRIAREMHDSLAQVLGVTHLRLRALGTKAAPTAIPGIVAELTDLADLTEEAYRDVREAILGLRESSRVDRGLVEGLRAFLEKFSHQSGVRTTLESTLLGEPSLSPRAEVQIIRVIQEALTNVRKHSGASSAVVRIENGGEATTFTIEDDGRGFDLTSRLLDRDAGFGLHTMRERMELIGGTLTVDSAPGKGTRIVARAPGVLQSPLPLEVRVVNAGADPNPARR